MKHIVISTQHQRAERYCEAHGIPLADTHIVMFPTDTEYALRSAMFKGEQATIHNLTHNFKYIANELSQISGGDDATQGLPARN